jgi:hypothetical protein
MRKSPRLNNSVQVALSSMLSIAEMIKQHSLQFTCIEMYALKTALTPSPVLLQKQANRDIQLHHFIAGFIAAIFTVRVRLHFHPY